MAEAAVTPLSAEERERVRDLITRSVRLLDAGAFADFIALFAPGAIYSMTSFSPEIGRDSVWLELERDELGQLLATSWEHIHDLAARTHFVTVEDFQRVGQEIRARSSFIVFRTDEVGRTGFYAIGSYDDSISGQDQALKITARRVRVQTQLLPVPTPMPL